ncbi:Alpha/Beta hydrolase protein [Camillea tinctor]|nr:Alpha/Beta hydrolase protein [Camillea tinctor]
MGQQQSHHFTQLETRVENPPGGSAPQGLALIAHGRMGGTFDQAPVRLLAEYLCKKRQLRVVTWNARGTGNSPGLNEWDHFGTWIGDVGNNDYNGMLNEHMRKFAEEYPCFGGDHKAKLFICGYSAGAIHAGCARPPVRYTGCFAPAHYILVSYPIESNPLIGLFKSGSYFRSVEALVQGWGWERLPDEYAGREPEVAAVLTVTGSLDTFFFYRTWEGILRGKNARCVLEQVVVEGAGHAWEGKAQCIVEEVEKWLGKWW